MFHLTSRILQLVINFLLHTVLEHIKCAPEDKPLKVEICWTDVWWFDNMRVKNWSVFMCIVIWIKINYIVVHFTVALSTEIVKDISSDAGSLCDKPALLGDKIKGIFFVLHFGACIFLRWIKNQQMH
jgi:hypothetical protein